MKNRSRKTYLTPLWSALVLLLALLHVAGAQVPAQSEIRNQAFATFYQEDRELRQGSNVVVTILQAVCDLSIVPSGSVLEPAHRVTVTAGRTVTLPYTLTNTGNTASDYLLNTVLMPESSAAPGDVRLIWDQNGNGVADSGEPVVTELTNIPPGQEVALLLAVTLQEGVVEGDIHIDLQGACAGEPAVMDAGNIAHITVAAPQGGFSEPVKTSEPSQDDLLHPGAELRYAIAFTANDLPLRDVVVTDTLDARLNDPASVTGGLITDPATGLSATATASYEGRTLRWTFAEIPAGMTVRLEVVTSVSLNAPLESPIENRACVREETTGAEACTNIVRHALAPVELMLEKTAEPAAATLGDEIRYSLRVSNPSERVPVRNVELRDTLPEGLSYTQESAVIAAPDGSQEAFPPTINGNVLVWRLPDLEPGQGLEVSFSATVESAALASTEVTNVAEAVSRDADGAVIVSDEDGARTEIFTICDLDVTPNGTVASPAHSATLLPGEVAYLPYTLTNTGNVLNSFTLESPLEPQSSATPESIVVVWDQNDNGVADPGEPVVTELTDIPPGALVSLLVRVARGPDPEQGGEAFVNLRAWCAGNPDNADTDNVSQLTFVLGGMTGPVKSADPAPGDVLQPGTPVRYYVEFTANELPLYDVVVTDTLDERLHDLLSFTGGLVVDEITGQSSEITASYENGTLRWHIPEVPAGMTVRLELETAVRMMPLAAAQGVIRNVVCLDHRESIGTKCSNEVIHTLQPLGVLLEKTADTREAGLGDEITYSLVVRNPSPDVTLERPVLTDPLPEALAYLPETSVLILPDGRQQPLEPAVTGNILTWQLPALAPGERVEVRFRSRVTADIINHAELVNEATVTEAEEDGTLLASATASVTTAVNLGIFAPRSIVMGHVYIDENENGVFDKDIDTPLEGVRLYLSNGVSVVTDAFGRYTVVDLEPGVLALRLDMTTVPARHLHRTVTEDKEGLWRLRLHPGLITRQDVIFAPASTMVAMRQSLRVSRGPVSITKDVTEVDGGLEVHLAIASAEALRDLTVVEFLPLGADIGAVSVNGQPVNPLRPNDGELEIAFGDVAEGFTGEVIYLLMTDGAPEEFMDAPEISWRLR